MPSAPSRPLPFIAMTMKTFTVLGLSLALHFASAASALRAQDAPTLPFKVELTEVSASTMPAIHSFCSGTWEGKWLILGGRIAGLHGFNADGKKNFPRSSANTIAYVLDPGTNKVLGQVDLTVALQAQPRLLGPLTSSNPEFVQVGSTLYVIGGYGKDVTDPQESMTTFGSLVAIDLQAAITAIIGGLPGDLSKAFQQNPASDSRLKVCGGELKYREGLFYLVFGQDFTGHYNVDTQDYNRVGGQFQKYTEKIRVFTLDDNLAIKSYMQADGGYDDTLPYHRRDLNVVDMILPDGKTPAAVVYGGVFKAGQVAGHVHPVDLFFQNPFNLTHDTAPTFAQVRKEFSQALSHYDCAAFTLYDAASQSSFTTLCGGISQYHYDATTQTLIQDELNLPVDGLPFIGTVSTIQHGPKVISQYIQPPSDWSQSKTLLGTDAQFLLAPGIATIPGSAVIDLASLTGRTLVGHIIGGIESFGPYSGLIPAGQVSTQASKRLFAVYITPGSSPVLPMPALPATPTPYKP